MHMINQFISNRERVLSGPFVLEAVVDGDRDCVRTKQCVNKVPWFYYILFFFLSMNIFFFSQLPTLSDSCE